MSNASFVRFLGSAAALSTLSSSVFAQAIPAPAPGTPTQHEAVKTNTAFTHRGVPFIDALADRGITPGLWFYGTLGKNLRGGADTSEELWDHVLGLSLTLDTERLFELSGGTFFVSFEHHDGDRFYDIVGDFGGSSDISAPGRDQINEIFYEQRLLDDSLRFKLGKMDVNSEFAIADAAFDFVNSTFYWSPTLVGMPTFPDAAFGGMIAWEPREECYFMAGVFDGAAQEGYRTGSRGPSTLIGSPADLYFVAEAGYRPSLYRNLPGRIALGAFHHSGTFERFDGGESDGTTGGYAVIEQAIFREQPDGDENLQGLTLFARAAVADRNVATVPWSFAIGGSWLGALPGRNADVFGVGVSYNGFTNSSDANFGGDEVIFEAFYRYQINEYAFIKPDVQYITNPGGTFDDAILIALRIGFEF